MSKKLCPDDCSPLTLAMDRGEVNVNAFGRGQYPGVRLSTGELPGLRSIGVWDAVGPQTWGLPMHRNEGIEICYLLKGETRFATDSGERMLRPGDITITRPWQRHCLGNPSIRACKLFWFIIDVESGDGRAAWEFPSWIGSDAVSRRELLAVFRKNQRCHLVDEGQVLNSFLQTVCQRLPSKGELMTAQISSWINYLLLEVGLRLSGEITKSMGDPMGFDQTIRQFFQGLEASVEKASEPWAVSDIARACRVGITYLTDSCHGLFNTTPSEQLNRIRLGHAAQMLKQKPEMSVTEIAFAVGFNTSQYFSTRFKKRYSVTPHAYR